MRCPACPTALPCDGYLCSLAGMSPDWDRHIAGRAALGHAHVTILPTPADRARAALLEAVRTCPHRGGVLPLSFQAQGCCAGGELSACAAGKGKVAGRVMLNDCLICVGGK